MPKEAPTYFSPDVTRFNSLKIVQRHQKGFSELSSTTKVLSKPARGSFGRHLVGELYLQKASQASPSEVSSWITLAENAFRSSSNFTDPSLDNTIRLKSNLRLANLSTLSIFFKKQSLPSVSSIKTSHHESLIIASAFKDFLDHNEYSRKLDPLGIIGTLGEVAILSLLNRWAIRDIGCDTVFSCQSFFDEDYGSDCVVGLGLPKWDINIYQSGLESITQQKISRTHKLQVKNSTRYNEDPNSYPEIQTVHINEDLAIIPGESFIIGKIISGCLIELACPEDAGRTTKELDQRTDQLLKIIDP